MEINLTGHDRYLYYRCLQDIVYGPSNTIMFTTQWRPLDKNATDEQKQQAFQEMVKWEKK